MCSMIMGNDSRLPNDSSERKMNLIIGVVILAILVLVGVAIYYADFNTPDSGSSQSTTAVSLTSVNVSGSLNTTGQATRVIAATFASGSKSYSANVSGNQYSIFLESPGSYKVSLSWAGNYSWQKGVVTTNLVLSSNDSSQLVKNFTVATPASYVYVTGGITSNTNGTHPKQVIFAGAHGETVSQLANSSTGNYVAEVPNLESYAVSVGWRGAYSWQSGSISVGGMKVDQTSNNSISKNWQISPPDSEVSVSGSASTTGNGTIPTSISFSNSGVRFSAPVINGSYSVVLGNLADYSTSVAWKGEYPWQSGSSSSTTLPVNVLTGVRTNLTDNVVASTPNSAVNVTGTIVTTGTGTTPLTIAISGPTGNFTLTLVSNSYSLILPNLATYNATIGWTGNYSWQKGNSSGLQLKLNAGPGAKTFSATLTVRTPDSIITVSGTVNSTLGVPYQIEFKGVGVPLDKIINVTGNGGNYSVVLPNQAKYTVLVNYTKSNGKNATCNSGTLFVNQSQYGPFAFKYNLRC